MKHIAEGMIVKCHTENRCLLIRTIFLSLPKPLSYLRHRLIQIPEKANKFQRSPGSYKRE